MNETDSFSGIVGPILADIGFDLARVRELSTDAVATCWHAHFWARDVLFGQLVVLVGERDAAERVLTHARQLPEATLQRRRHQYAEAIEADRIPKPRELAAHIAYAIDIESVFAFELQRRAGALSVN